MSKGLEALEQLFNAVASEFDGLSYMEDFEKCKCVIEKELKALEIIKKCFYVAKSSGAILLTDYGFEHEKELKEVLL